MVLLVAVWPSTVTLIGPVAAPAGTETVSDVVVAAVTIAVAPLENITPFEGASALKFVPVIVTVVPTGPLCGEKPEIVGAGPVVAKLVLLVVDWPPTVSPIGPVAAPTGTITVNDVVVAEVTVAVGFVPPPVNVTMSAEGVALKFVPMIVTVVPTGPVVGEKLVIFGAGVKLVLLVADRPPTVTVIGPAVAPAGINTVSEVVVAALTVAVTPLKKVTLFAEGVALKFVPEIVTTVPTGPLDGEKLAIVGATVKFVLLVAVWPPTVTWMGPVVAPVGTLTVREVVVAAVTVAAVPLNFTVSADGVALKFVPEITTVVPIAPPVGEKPEIVGAGPAPTVKFELLVAICVPPTLTVIGPVVAVGGTVTVTEVLVALVAAPAYMPLNRTRSYVPSAAKFVPVMVTDVPAGPNVGENPVMVGAGTVKDALLVVSPFIVPTHIGPVAALEWTLTTILLVVAETISAAPELKKSTVGLFVKKVPLIVTVSPATPLVGVKLEMCGGDASAMCGHAISQKRPTTQAAMNRTNARRINPLSLLCDPPLWQIRKGRNPRRFVAATSRRDSRLRQRR